MGKGLKIIFATQNQNKLKEVAALLPNINLMSLNDLECFETLSETGQTLRENAFIKAKHIWEKYKIPCFADDTGLQVRALNGEPGVYSARYAGIEKDAKKNKYLLLKNLNNHNDRAAYFKTVIALFFNDQPYYFEGICEGEITLESIGNQGFGYDSIFKPKGYNVSFAQMDLQSKGIISHRGKAIRKLVDFLKDNV